MNNKISLFDVTFLIPVRIDSIIRVENLLSSINSILSNFDTNIIVLESSRYNNHLLEKLLPNDVQYIFIEDWDPVFHRTRYINELFDFSHTQIISIWDADIILPAEQILDAINALRCGDADVSFPYDGKFINVPDPIRDIFIETSDINLLLANTNKCTLPYGSNMGGGALFITSEAYIKTNKEDERFYGWGPEDWNRIEKWKLYQLKFYRAEGPLFHLSHPRDINGSYSCDLQKRLAFSYLEQTRNSEIDDLQTK